MNEIAGTCRVEDRALDQRHDRATDDRHHQPGGAEFRRGTQSRERDTVDRREHQRQAEGQRDDGDNAGHVRREHGEDAEQDRKCAEHCEHLRRADPPDHPGHDEARDQEHDQADLQQEAAQLERSVQRLLRVLDEVCPGADLGRDVEELRYDAELVALVRQQDLDRRFARRGRPTRNSSTIGGDFLIAITNPMAIKTNPSPR